MYKGLDWRLPLPVYIEDTTACFPSFTHPVVGVVVEAAFVDVVSRSFIFSVKGSRCRPIHPRGLPMSPTVATQPTQQEPVVGMVEEEREVQTHRGRPCSP